MATCRRRKKGAILMGKYFDELARAMEYLGEQPDTMFLGQAVEYSGTAMSNTLKNVDRSKLTKKCKWESLTACLWQGQYQLVFILDGIFFCYQ